MHKTHTPRSQAGESAKHITGFGESDPQWTKNIVRWFRQNTFPSPQQISDDEFEWKELGARLAQAKRGWRSLSGTEKKQFIIGPLSRPDARTAFSFAAPNQSKGTKSGFNRQTQNTRLDRLNSVLLKDVRSRELSSANQVRHEMNDILARLLAFVLDGSFSSSAACLCGLAHSFNYCSDHIDTGGFPERRKRVAAVYKLLLDDADRIETLRNRGKGSIRSVYHSFLQRRVRVDIGTYKSLIEVCRRIGLSFRPLGRPRGKPTE